MATKITTRVLADDAVTDAKIADVALTTATASASDNSTKAASTAYVTTAIANLVDSAPSTLNTLNELAAALGDDANYATTTTNAIAAKLPLAGGTLTGNLTMGGMMLKPSGDGGSIGFNRNPDNGNHVGDSAKRRFQINGPDDSGGDLLQIQSYNSSGTHQGNINIVDGNVGIGNTIGSFHSSVLPLIVGSGSGDEGMAIYSGNASKGKLGFADAATDDSGSYRGYFQYDHSGDNLNIGTAGSERLRIDSSGNIGFNTIGLSAGSTDSSQASTATPKRIVFNNDYSNGYTDASLKLYLFNSNTTRQGFTSGPAYDLQYHSSGSDSGRHAFYVANTEIMRIGKTQAGVGDVGNAVMASNTTTTFVVRKDNSAGRGGELSIVNYASNATGNEAALNFGLENSTYHNNDGNAQIKARVMGSSAQTAMIFSNWRGSAFTEAFRISEAGHLAMQSGKRFYFDVNSIGSGDTYIDEYTSNKVGITTNGSRKFALDDGDLYVSGSVNANHNFSDERLKENIVVIPDALEKVNSLRGITFTRKEDGRVGTGLIAQELEKVLPEAVYESKKVDSLEDPDAEEWKAINYGNTVGLLVEAIKELESRVKELEG